MACVEVALYIRPFHRCNFVIANYTHRWICSLHKGKFFGPFVLKFTILLVSFSFCHLLRPRVSFEQMREREMLSQLRRGKQWVWLACAQAYILERCGASLVEINSATRLGGAMSLEELKFEVFQIPILSERAICNHQKSHTWLASHTFPSHTFPTPDLYHQSVYKTIYTDSRASIPS